MPRSPSYRPRGSAEQVRDLVGRQLRSAPRIEDADLDLDAELADLDDELDGPQPPAAAGRTSPGGELRRRLADRLPPTLRAARVRVGAPAAVGFLLVAVLVAVGLAVLAWRTWPAGATPPSGESPGASSGTAVPARTEPVAATSGTTSGTGPGPTATPSGPATVVVHVAGRVAAPGLVTLPAGSRVADAVAAAGGPGGDADLDRLNLARPLVDGEQVLVPVVGAAGEVGAPPTGTTSATGPSGPLDLNTATAADLDALPGVGEVLAARIVAWREENGRFSAVDELGEVQGIGPKVLAGLRDLVRV